MVMGFTKDFRSNFVTRVQKRYKSYWHAMHPRDFESRELYKLGFTKKEWAALLRLRDRRKEVLKSGWNWTYRIDLTMMPDRPEYIPKEPALTFKVKEGWPEVEILESQMREDERMKLRDWIITAYQYQNDSNILGRKLNELLRMQYQHTDRSGYHNRTVERANVNTPGTLHRVWPELLPFLDSGDRHTLRNKKVKSPLPKDWTEETLAEFHYGPAMERISYALTVMSLIPNKHDKKYPTLD
jgi:hypothetical protein